MIEYDDFTADEVADSIVQAARRFNHDVKVGNDSLSKSAECENCESPFNPSNPFLCNETEDVVLCSACSLLELVEVYDALIEEPKGGVN